MCKVSYKCSSEYSAYDGRCTYTHMSLAHFSGAHRVCILQTSSCVSHTRMAQVSAKGSLHMCQTSPISHLMIHLSLLFLDGHLETNPDYDFTDSDIHEILPNFPDPKARVKRTLHEDEPSVDDVTMLINDPDHDFSDFQ